MSKVPYFAMVFNTENFYHPFSDSYLGFFGYDDKSKENDTCMVLENIDLYYQPVEEPAFGTIVLVTHILSLILGELVQFRLLAMVKNENGLVKEVTQIYSLTSIICCPISIIFTCATDFIHPLNEVIGQWFCTLAWIITFFFFSVITFQSFIVAMMRYCFIVHDEKVRKFGKEKTKRIFEFLTLFIPLMLVILEGIENPELHPFIYINRCYGKDHRLFLMDHSNFQVSNPYFCQFENHNDEGTYGTVLQILRKSSCISRMVINILMGFNFSEAILYYKIFSHMKR